MLTWSSRPALEGIESTLAGWQRTLFSLTSDALATCAIMKPEWSPLPAARKGVSPVESAGFTSCSTRRSLMFASSRDGDGREIEGQRERLAVEVAAADEVRLALRRPGRRWGCR